MSRVHAIRSTMGAIRPARRGPARAAESRRKSHDHQPGTTAQSSSMQQLPESDPLIERLLQWVITTRR